MLHDFRNAVNWILEARNSMIRLIKRYGGGTRKLYDTEESRYVSLEEISVWVREGQDVQVLDSATGEDVTAATLAQSLYEDQKRGTSMLSSDFLHSLIRRGGQALAETLEQAEAKFGSLLQTSVSNLASVGPLQDEMSILRERLQELESSLAELEKAPQRAAAKPRSRAKTPPKSPRAATQPRSPRRA
jgi:polyhydroxyalkanoate synthesis repressor PhaR